MENFIGWTDANAQSVRDAIGVAICDDEVFMLELLEEKIKNMLPSAVIEQFSSGRDLLEGNTQAEVFNRKVIIHTINGDTEYYGKLSDLEKKVGEDFFRPHRSYLIHFKYVLRYDAVSAVMENGTALIAKQNYPKFVKQYLKYNQRKGREIR